MTKLLCSFLLCYSCWCSAQTYELTSPDFKLKLAIENLGQLRFSAFYEDKTVIDNAEIGLELTDGRMLARDAKIRSAKPMYLKNILKPEVKIKNAEIIDEFNELTLVYRDGYSVVLRVYNDAVAYRFVTALKDSTVLIKNELLTWQANPSTLAYLQKVDQKENFLNNYERLYTPTKLSNLSESVITQLPLLLDDTALGLKVQVTETDLQDYPGMYLEADKTGMLKAVFPAVVKSTQMPPKPQWGWDRTETPVERYDYIADTKGTRALPWRIMAIAKEDKELITNEVAYKLAPASKIADISWIKPGKVAWDWWNNWNLTGVPFKAGINNATYKAYIDFAAKYGLDYIMMDDGWYVLGDLTKEAAGINVAEIVAYGKQKNVGVMLWASWKTLDQHMTAVMDLWQQWGVKGIKIDFMDRDDQWMVNFYERCAAEAAKRQLLVDFHGAFKPAGLQRAYPNVLNFEGVLGLEQNKWGGQNANPDMAVTIPFIRMFAGPLDYTPGAMLNAQKSEYAAINHKPMSLGTRCQQLAMYVVYDAPLQMLSDSPTHYEKEPECMEFLAKVPTTWDKTLALGGTVGEFVTIARQKGEEWYVGTMTNWKARDITLNFSFLPEGNYELSVWHDGINADRTATDYQLTKRTITNKDVLTWHLAPGGGLAARLKK